MIHTRNILIALAICIHCYAYAVGAEYAKIDGELNPVTPVYNIYYLFDSAYADKGDELPDPDYTSLAVHKGKIVVTSNGLIYYEIFLSKYVISEIFPTDHDVAAKFSNNSKWLIIRRRNQYLYFYKPEGFSADTQVSILAMFSH